MRAAHARYAPRRSYLRRYSTPLSREGPNLARIPALHEQLDTIWRSATHARYQQGSALSGWTSKDLFGSLLGPERRLGVFIAYWPGREPVPGTFGHHPTKPRLTYQVIDLIDPELETAKIEDIFTELNQNKTGVRIHSRILAFPTGTMKTNWIPSVTEADRWNIFSAWFQAPERGAFVSIG